MASRKITPPTGAPSESSNVPQLEHVKDQLDAERNIARLLHRVAQEIREELPDGAAFPSEARADVDALCSELGRLEQRLSTLAESLDVPGGAEVIPLRREVIA